jgi:SAM-dependent methyltransferase
VRGVDLRSAAFRVRDEGDPPSPWLLRCADLLPDAGRALDVACGRGRHALLLAAAGFEVTALDRDPELLRAVAEAAARRGLAVTTTEMDLEVETADLGEAAFDVVVVFRYLHRPLFPALKRALAPGGLLVYETFTREQAEHGHPKNPAFLLEAGELPRLVAPLDVLRYHEGERDGAFVAGSVARKLRTIPRERP